MLKKTISVKQRRNEINFSKCFRIILLLGASGERAFIGVSAPLSVSK